MKTLLTSLAQAVPGALITGFLWYFVNLIAPQKGVGFLERQPWPLNNLYVCCGFGALAAASSVALAGLFDLRRRRSMEAAGMMAGLQFSATVNRSSLGIAGGLHVFDSWQQGRNLLSGDVGGTFIRLFDLTTQRNSNSTTDPERGSRSATETETRTVFLISLDKLQLPAISILRNKWFAWTLKLFDVRGIEFHVSDESAPEEDRKALERFREQYFVTHGPATQRFPAEFSDAEAQELFRELEQLISLPLLKKLTEDATWNIEFSESHVAIWKSKTLVKPSELGQRLSEVMEIYHLIVDGRRDRPDTKLSVRGAAKMDVNVSGTHIGTIVGSGCAGMVLAFALFIPVFFLFAEEHPWIVFIWPFFGLAVVGCCVFAAVRLTAKWRS